ncbi:hypothetical protein [Mycolicibacterium agri]|uniref:hypothetical protein n=1 Tax=Mycolicibacterium agri TaxID=36811 RepID=UPI001055F2E2|nr:hypothetical protein [Mycolicibacterium agri]
MTWKVIVATDGAWTGELYSSRPGRGRIGFTSVESFCAAMMVVTDWPLGPVGDATAPPVQSARPRPNARAHTRKFIVAASGSWIGELYRTRPGLGHLHFGTFEQFLRAVMDITGWSLD